MAGNTFHHPVCPGSSYNKYPLNWISICFYHSCMHFFCPLPAWKGEKAMAPHSSTVAWKIPWMEEPGRLQSMGSHRDGHNWSNLAAAAAWKEFLIPSFCCFFCCCFFCCCFIFCCSVAKSCPTLCDPIDCSTPVCRALHYLPEFAQIHVHWVTDPI